jgi:hypothetical protein
VIRPDQIVPASTDPLTHDDAIQFSVIQALDDSVAVSLTRIMTIKMCPAQDSDIQAKFFFADLLIRTLDGWSHAWTAKAKRKTRSATMIHLWPAFFNLITILINSVILPVRCVQWRRSAIVAWTCSGVMSIRISS